jgi:signal transduction histidine kinase
MMSYKQLYFMSTTKPVNITSFGNNSIVKKVSAFEVSKANDKNTKSHLLLQLKELEKINSKLENLVLESNVKLDEVISTNAKFLSILAHDLRSPFQSIIGALDLLEESISDHENKEIENYINIASNSAFSTLRLLENLLSWTSSQNKEKNFKPVKVNLHETIRIEIENVEIMANQKLITVNSEVSPDLYVTADLEMVRTILRNLIINAIKYSYLGGEISIKAAENNQFVEIDVIDNGVGISQNAQRELFQRAELHSTKGTNNEKGTGLGLLLCKEFITMHGGIIWIESEAGKGTKIKFTLPRNI